MTHLVRATAMLLLCSLTVCGMAGPSAKEVLAQCLVSGAVLGVTPMRDPGYPLAANWIAPVESGTLRWWVDANRDGTVDADEVRQERYAAVYRAHLWASDIASFTPEDTAGDSGAFIGVLRDFSSWKPANSTPVTSIQPMGDGVKGWLVRDTIGGGEEGAAREQETLLISGVRGPFRIFVEISCDVTLAGNINLQADQLAPVYVLDKPDFDARITRWREERLPVACQLLQRMLTPLDSWCRTKAARGTGFKGLFPYTLLYCYPSLSDLPADYDASPALASIKNPDTSYNVTYGPRSRNGTYTLYRVVMQITHFHDSDQSDTDWLDRLKRTVNDGDTKAGAVSWAGVDAAYRRQYRDAGSNYDVFTFRTANVVVQIKGETHGDPSPAHPLPLTDRIAAFMLAKLYGSSAPPLRAPVSLAITGPARVWATGGRQQYVVTAMQQVTPASQVPCTLEVAQGALGECSVTQIMTDVHGKAVFSYTPLRPGTNVVTVRCEDASASWPVKQGGIWIQQQPASAADIPADGKSASRLLIRCVDPDAKPMPGVRLSVSVDDRALSKRGILKPLKAWVSDAKGEVWCTYTPPDMRTLASFRFANVVVSAQASLGTPAATVSTAARLRIVRSGTQPVNAIPLTVSVRHAQVLDLQQCNQWVAGKPAMLRARITWDNPSVEVVACVVTFTWNGNSIHKAPVQFKKQYTRPELAERRDTAWAVMSPDRVGEGQIGVRFEDIRISCTGGATVQAPDMEKLDAVTVRPSEQQLRVLFVPVAIGSWTGRERMDSKLFDALRHDQLRYVSGLFPLPPAAVQDISQSNVMFVPEQAMNEPVVSEGSLLARMEALSAEYPGAYVLGLVPDDWLHHAGTSARDRFPHAMLISVNPAGGAMDTLLAHEWMHLLGFDHNSVTSEATSGVWIRDAATKDIMDMDRAPGADFWDIMNIDPTTSAQTWIGQRNYERLMRRLLPN